MSSNRWKTLERTTANILGGERVTESWTLFNTRPDVLVPLPNDRRMVCECKAYKRFSHHKLIETCQAKYCTGNDVPALITKHAGQHGEYITLPLQFVSELLKTKKDQNT